MLPGVNNTFARDFSVSSPLVNPGGPGGSGISFALGAAERLRQVVGEGQDIIGFNPRGVGEPTPQVDCFVFPRVHNCRYHRGVLQLQYGVTGSCFICLFLLIVYR